MVAGKGLRPLQVAAVILVVRLLSVFLVQTWYEADEYWQTLEVAHKQVFGYGEITWEWKKGIRSYLYPSIIAVLYSVLKFTGLDYPEAVVLVPRLLQAVISSVGDYHFYKWAQGRKWALFLILTAWFWFYTSGRTLLQSLETSIVAVALSHFPFKNNILSQYEKENSNWLWLACICLFVRPTTAALWGVLVVYNFLTTNQTRLRLLIGTYLPIAATTSAALIGLDSFFYGRLIITPWEFFRFNVLHDVASFYGTHPWHWYISQGVPAVLGINLIPVLFAIFSILRRPAEHKSGVVLVTAAALHVALYSLIPHKEFRFVLPLLPIFLYLAQDVIVRWSRKAVKWQLYVASILLLIGNIVPALYFGLIHQAGTLQVMPLLRESIENNRTSILFMMPCHSTPAYSHLHANITTRHLTCEPPFNKIGETYESEYFFNNPQRWWKTEYNSKQTPNIVVLFDKLKGRVEGLLAGYRLKHTLPHTQFPSGEIGENVLVYEKQTRPADAAA